MSGGSDMKLQYGNFFKTKIFTAVYLLFFITSLNCYASFCRCTPEYYEPVRIFAAPQIARLELTIQGLAIYRGVFKGGSAGFEYKPFCDFYFGAFAEWMMGHCDSEMDMSRYIHDLDGQLRLGYNFPMWNLYKLTFTPFLGLGYEQLAHHIRPDLVLNSEKFRYEHYYFPYGLLIDLRVTKHFGFGFVGEYTTTINQNLTTPYIQGIKFQLARRAGYLVEVPFHLYLGSQKSKMEISIIPYLKGVVDGTLLASLPNDAAITLPKQTYKFWGLRLAVGAVF